MRKFRTLDSTDFGVASPTTYRKTSTTGTNHSIRYPWPLEAEQYARTLNLIPAAPSGTRPAYLQGQEVFESSEHKKPMFNDCRHSKLTDVNYMYTAAAEFSGSYRYYSRIRNSVGTRIVPADFLLLWKMVSSNMRAGAYWSMRPKFEGDISLLNFFFEMKDFRDITAANFKQLEKVHHKYPWTKNSGTPRVSKLLAEARLVKSFVIDPLVKDLKAIWRDTTSIVEDLQVKFQEAGLQPQSRHFSQPLDQSQNLVTISSVVPSPWCLQGSKYSQVWTATAEFTYGYTLRNRLKAIAKYWGMTLTAEAVWNAMPFSFLVDYIFSIGKSLKAMRIDQNLQYTLHQYCESIRGVSQWGNFIAPDPARKGCHVVIDDVLTSSTDFTKPLLTAGVTRSLYERRVLTPYWGPYLPSFKVPNSGQMLNMAALLRCFI